MSAYGFGNRDRAGGGPCATPEEAADAHLIGWNLRCNRCGLFGASWIVGQRPGWGSLALCDPHADELDAEIRRHEAALRELREVNFEQPGGINSNWLERRRRDARREARKAGAR